MSWRQPRLGTVIVAGLLCFMSCSSDTFTETTETTETVDAQSDGQATGEATGGEDFPDIIAVHANREDGGTWRFDVTVSSPYDSRGRYADAWRVVGPDGTEFGIRVLTHDHASEQPFTRSQGGIAIPADVTTVTVAGRDLANGWGGRTLDVQLG